MRFLSRAFSLLLLIYLLGYAVFGVTLPRGVDNQRTDAIVVLTGGSNRLERGFALLQRRAAPKMLISGVARTVRPKELAVAYNIEERWLDCCVTLGREAYDTRSNAEEVADWVARNRIRSIRLVTNDSHMARARYEVRRRTSTDLRIVGDPVPSEPSFTGLFVEYNKYVAGRVADLIGI